MKTIWNAVVEGARRGLATYRLQIKNDQERKDAYAMPLEDLEKLIERGGRYDSRV